jgi:glycolate oxidase iron-sulfur subunit
LDLAPVLDAPAFQPPHRVAAATAPPRQQVSLFRGCVQDVLFPQVGRAALSVLSRCGAEVTVPRSQTCCGALLLHGGDRAAALRLAARNVAVFSRVDESGPIVVTASGCASALKEGAELLGTAQARAFAARIRDVTEVVDDLGLPVAPSPLPLKVVYQDPCHLRHACGVIEAPRRMLRSIPQLDLVELPDVDTCCGSAGIYNLTQPAIARELMERKVRSVIASGAQLVASGNPGCLIQLQAGLRAAGVADRIVALHPIELVSRALERSG